MNVNLFGARKFHDLTRLTCFNLCLSALTSSLCALRMVGRSPVVSVSRSNSISRRRNSRLRMRFSSDSSCGECNGSNGIDVAMSQKEAKGRRLACSIHFCIEEETRVRSGGLLASGTKILTQSISHIIVNWYNQLLQACECKRKILGEMRNALHFLVAGTEIWTLLLRVPLIMKEKQVWRACM